MTVQSLLTTERANFHKEVLKNVLRVTSDGRPSNADKSSTLSVGIAEHILSRLGQAKQDTLAGQSSGALFEQVCERFLNTTFPMLAHLRPGPWKVDRTGPAGNKGANGISKFEQYEHLVALKDAADDNSELAAALGTDYIIKPDIMVYRLPLDDSSINAGTNLVDSIAAKHTSLRSSNQTRALLHASVSCKWTIRSDRSQNSRSEALNLVRNRKGRVPHIVVVTAEPLPSRIASVALGTGDLDCVYHFALYELQEAVQKYGNDDSKEILNVMINGKRLRDISDLPLDLVI